MSIAAELRERILAAPDLHRELVEVPEWGVSLYVRVMTARERDAFEAQQLTLARQDRGTDNIRARLVVLTAVDEQGARVFGDADADALDALCRLVLASGAASCWGEYVDGLWRVIACGRRGLLALDRASDADDLLSRLPAVRLAHLLTGEGVFAQEMFRDARLAAMGVVFGAQVEARMRERMAA